MYSLLRRAWTCRAALSHLSRHGLSAHALVTTRTFTATLSRRLLPENVNVEHSRFLAEGTSQSKWGKTFDQLENGAVDHLGDEADSLPNGKGKLSPTSSHLFKLLLPLSQLGARGRLDGPPTVFLLHPSQPLSHVGHLIAASLAPETPSVVFRSTSPRGRQLQWSDSTDVGDFIRIAARATEFEIVVNSNDTHRSLEVEVPTFADRTRFLRRRMVHIKRELQGMEELKLRCDKEAHRGARRMALGGLGMMVGYWAVVARLTFWDLGWDIMEPVTYLSSLSMVILGYLWFLYQGREVSYSSMLDRSISTRRQALYKARDFDIDKWIDLMSELKGLRRELHRIAEDYDERRLQEDDKQEETEESQDVEEIERSIEDDEKERTSDERKS